MNKHERFTAQDQIDVNVENHFAFGADVAGFTGDKLDWLTALSADHRIDARAFEVAFCIVQHVNRKSGTAFVSTETISEKTGIPERWIKRARADLRDAGWIRWKRTKTANVYTPLDGPMNAILDQQVLLKDHRDERRKQRSHRATRGPSCDPHRATRGPSRRATRGPRTP